MKRLRILPERLRRMSIAEWVRHTLFASRSTSGAEPARSLPNGPYSGRITGNPEVIAGLVTVKRACSSSFLSRDQI